MELLHERMTQLHLDLLHTTKRSQEQLIEVQTAWDTQRTLTEEQIRQQTEEAHELHQSLQQGR